MNRSTTAGRILLTGITGAIGGWLAREALQRGMHVLALTRDESQEAAERRVSAVLDTLGVATWRSQVEILRGDVCKEGFGLGGRAGVLRGITLLIHCAACTEFRESRAQLVRRTNLDGTRHALDLAARLGLRFVHLSTAYVAGQRAGVATERELNVGQSFNNEYERSKCEAEALVHEWARQTGLPAFVLRPSIVVGDSQHGRALRFNTLYDLMQVCELVAPKLGGEEFRVVARPEATKNLIPVDYLARAAMHIVARGVPDVYHITNPKPLAMNELRDIFERLFGLDRVRLVEAEEFGHHPATRAERFFRNSTAVYAPYLLAEPAFDRANTDAALAGTDIALPAMDYAFFERLCSYARSVNWGRCRERKPESVAVIPPDYDRYFGEFLANKMHQRLLPNLQKLTATFAVRLKDMPRFHWAVAIERGVMTAVSRNGLAVQCTFALGSATFREVVAGRLSPPEAFFRRRIDIQGDIETGLRLATVLKPFFQRYPFEVRLATTQNIEYRTPNIEG